MGQKGRVCVTGAGGFCASWVVKLLLSKGYTVHGTVRNPDDERNAHLKKFENASTNLRLFKADLLDNNAISSAISGCQGVFHVASPVPPGNVPDPEKDLLNPAVKGTLNVLKESKEAGVQRVVFVSSVAAVMMNPNWPQDKVMDENCWSDKQYCRTTENWYCLSKTMAESEAFEYAQKSGLDLVSVCPALVLGPMLQPTINASSLVLIKLLKGEQQCVPNRTRYIVDVRDLAEALLLVYKKPNASGRYVAVDHRAKVKEMVEIMGSQYPNYNYPKQFTDGEEDAVQLSSEKLQRLGWKLRPLEETLLDSVKYFEEAGLVSRS
ncbi:cinnamoyl-CoA reductase 2-like [Amborella trichopoda]|uniref:cinnamoyl-CoA reductase 2-like n=1 Tax=Amborella trichopoda TaxID=13333 RepID=UPI0005D31890|nr:cinnamoyl-CoA reductase 2-like [Amborella trichopoda]XP_020526340.1 cinnamoyl-CoA reductase 2-like [Amborella trichopoda]|eukprot:XP_011625419.1 cinnamoyl-CoA reductase 2-like [Amborella trichopoda]